MHEEYIKETKIKEKNDNERKLELIIVLLKLKENYKMILLIMNLHMMN